MKVKAAVIREWDKGYNIEELELEEPKAGEAQVKWLYTGYCHSDLSVMTGRIPMALPMVAGHECAGVVEAVGPGVTRVKPGDKVVGTWMIPCGVCPECHAGRGNVCTGSFQYFVAGTMFDGTARFHDVKGDQVLHGNFVSGYASHSVVPEGGLVPITQDVPMEQACLMSCCIPTGWGSVTNIAGVLPGDSVAIWGMGGVGQNILRAAKLRQANPLIVVDLEESRRQVALDLGASHFINSSKEDPVPIIQELTHGGADYCFDATGNPGAYEQMIWCLSMAGKIIAIGIMAANEVAKLPLTFFSLQQKSILGGLYGAVKVQDDIPRLLDYMATGEMKIDRMIEGKFKLEQINEIAEKMEHRQLNGRWVCEWD